MNEKFYENQSDEELIAKLRTGETDVMDYLMEKYKHLVRMKANTMFLLGGDTDDLIQEGMIGLFKAVRDFKPDKDSSFATFAGICITRQIYKAIEAASRKKHGPLNTYVSLSVDEDMRNGQVQSQLGASSVNDPENMLINQEELEQFLNDLNQALSPMEQQVLELHLAGQNYRQIAQILGKTEKSIDNALQRMKQKIGKLREE